MFVQCMKMSEQRCHGVAYGMNDPQGPRLRKPSCEGYPSGEIRGA